MEISVLLILLFRDIYGARDDSYSYSQLQIHGTCKFVDSCVESEDN